MTATRMIVHAVGALIASAVVLALVAVASLVVAMSGGHGVAVPGLVTVTAGADDELASVSTAGAGPVLWYLGVAALLTALGLGADAATRRRRRRAR